MPKIMDEPNYELPPGLEILEVWMTADDALPPRNYESSEYRKAIEQLDENVSRLRLSGLFSEKYF